MNRVCPRGVGGGVRGMCTYLHWRKRRKEEEKCIYPSLFISNVRTRCESRALGPGLTSSAYLSGQIDPDIYEPGSDINIISLIIAIMNSAGGKITLGWGSGWGQRWHGGKGLSQSSDWSDLWFMQSIQRPEMTPPEAMRCKKKCFSQLINQERSCGRRNY